MNEEMKRMYDQWNLKKQDLQKRIPPNWIYFNEGDVWWCSLGLNLGSETFGKGRDFCRPMLIIKKLSSELCIALPITSNKKEGTWFTKISIKDESRWVMLHQIRMIHKKRFQRKVGRVDSTDFNKTKEKLETLLELS